METRKVSEIIYREDLYPRIEKNPITVQQYAEALDVLPPIEINQRNELIDGWHRWTAHKKNNKENIDVEIIQTESDINLLELAIEKNSTHGLQLSQEDKRNMARRIYHVTPNNERKDKKTYLAKILSVPERTIRDWLSRIDKDAKDARNKRIFELWLSCHTQEEIAEREDVSKMEVSRVCNEMAELPKCYKPAAEHLVDFEVPIYNVWKWQEKSKGSSHPGNTESIIVDRLLYLYTKPFDIVIDPFAGGGSTIDICKKRFRRYYVSDRLPIVERESEIRKHDLIDGLPKVPRWNEVKLVYLDPPYWKQAEGQYSEDENDLANMSIDDFNSSLSKIIIDYSKKLSSGSYIALIIQPTQWKSPNKEYTDHIADMLNMVRLPIEIRISCPYESQQNNAQMVNWSKENKKLLVITREIVVWRI